MTSDELELPCLLAPIADGQLLLPSVAVAEVVRGQRVRGSDGLPPWCVGRIMWRGVIVPLLIFERANDGGDEVPEIRPGDGVLVMNRTRDMAGLTYYGIVSRGTPRLLRLTDEDLEIVTDSPLRSAELARVQVGEDEAVIPRLAYLEELIIQHRLTGPVARV